jgi:hypothetical protein
VVLCAFSPARAWRPAVVAHLARTLGIAIQLKRHTHHRSSQQSHRNHFALEYFLAIAGICILGGLGVFFWKRFGTGSGRALGNRIAEHNGIPRKVFYYLLDNGVKGSTHDLLVSLERSNITLDQASIAVAPSLNRGIERLEARFGTQSIYEMVKPIVAKLVAQSELNR